MKAIIAIIFFGLIVFGLNAQSFLPEISVGFSEKVKIHGFDDANGLSDKLSTALKHVVDSLSKAYDYKFIISSNELRTEADLIIDVSLRLSEVKGISYGELFKYTSIILFKEAKTDSIVAKAEITYKDLLNSSMELLISGDFSTYSKVLSKLIIPLHKTLPPTNILNDRPCLCLMLEGPSKSKINQQRNVAETLTNILNNALVHHQKYYSYEYYDKYKSKNKGTTPPRNCHSIKGTLSVVDGSYQFRLNFDNTLNLSVPKQVQVEFYFDTKRIASGDYYEAIWQINKSVYTVLDNNSALRIRD
jgi:hypothetical protein